MTFPFRQPRLQLGPFRPDIPLAIDETHPLAKHVRVFVLMDGPRMFDLVSGRTLTPSNYNNMAAGGHAHNGAWGMRTTANPDSYWNYHLGRPIQTFTFMEVSVATDGYHAGFGLRGEVGVGSYMPQVFFQATTSVIRVVDEAAAGTGWGSGVVANKRHVKAVDFSDGVPGNTWLDGGFRSAYSGSLITPMVFTRLAATSFYGYNGYSAGSVYEAAILFDRVLTAAEHREIAANVYALTRPAIPMPVFTAAAATPNFDIPTTSYAVSLPTPTLTSQTAFSVPATSYTATLPAPNFTTATALDVPVTSYAVTLPAPSFTTVTALDVPAISYAETLPAPSFTTNTALDIPAISYTTTLPAPSFTTATVHSVPVISYTVTLPAITVSSVSTEAMQIMAGDWAVRTSAADWAVRRNEADWAVRIEAGDWKYNA